jgi:hypothetical protein
MSIIIHRAPRFPEDVVPPSVSAEGTPFPLCMFFSGMGSMAYADSYAELVDALIPGYGTYSDPKALVARVDYAHSQAVWVQAQVWADNEEPLTPAQEQLLAAPRMGVQAPSGVWEAPVPLVVLSVAYEPYTDVVMPLVASTATDTVWVIDPVSEESFLESLHEVGSIRLMRRSEPVD